MIKIYIQWLSRLLVVVLLFYAGNTNAQFTLNAPTGNGESNYQWYAGTTGAANTISGATNATYTPTAEGVYFATYDAMGCGGATNYFVLTDDCNGDEIVTLSVTSSGTVSWSTGDNGTSITITATSVPETYSATTILGGCNETIASFTVANIKTCNTTVAVSDLNNTLYETPVVGNVSTNDKDEDGDTQTFSLVGSGGGLPPTEGAVSFNSEGVYTFTPATGFAGGTSFTYQVCDDGSPSVCDTALVYIEVLEEVSAEGSPVIANIDANDVVCNATISGNILSNDIDPDERVIAVTTTLNNAIVPGTNEEGNTVANAGTLSINSDGNYTFTPTTSFEGIVIQTYTISTSGTPGQTDNANLILTVNCTDGNTTSANDDAGITDAGIRLTGDISVNDADSEGDNQSVCTYEIDTNGDGDSDMAGTVGAPTNVGGTNDAGTYVPMAGTLTINADGSYIFIPVPTFIGNVIIVYTACDDATLQAMDDATLVITVLDAKRDYGDAPNTYPEVWHRALTDSDSDENLDGASDVWLGMQTSFEISQNYDGSAAGDTNDDAITFGSDPGNFPLTVIAGQSYNVNLVVNSTASDLVYYGMWIDWDEDGTYEDFYSGSQATSSPATAIVNITAPTSVGSLINVRVRADDEPLIVADYAGGKTNGEVEDYQAAVVLPIDLVSFTGRPIGCEVQLNWSVASEENFSHYEVERSDGGQRFELIEQIEGEGSPNSFSQYQFVDETAQKVNYYRLRAVDLDGSYEYSEIVFVETSCVVDQVFIYPNPISKGEAINVNFYAYRDDVLLEIIDLFGRVVKRSVLNVYANEANTVKINLSDLTAGTYFLQINGDIHPKKFIVME